MIDHRNHVRWPPNHWTMATKTILLISDAVRCLLRLHGGRRFCQRAKETTSAEMQHLVMSSADACCCFLSRRDGEKDRYDTNTTQPLCNHSVSNRELRGCGLLGGNNNQLGRLTTINWVGWMRTRSRGRRHNNFALEPGAYPEQTMDVKKTSTLDDRGAWINIRVCNCNNQLGQRG
jgi:hypothetical protein